MASRNQQDAFMDDSDDSCPLCVEEFDLSDKNFRPCPCGYQVCQFCYNNIKNNMNGLCPACRRPYDDKNIEWKIISPEEAKADLAAQAKKKALARQKETERRQVETLNRKHLAGLRVVQKNLVYVVGLNPKSREEDLLQTLRGDQYFGQYGKIIKIVVSKAKEGAPSNSIGVYVTFARQQDAAKCIAAVDGSQNGDRVLRAQNGTTKYCSAYLRGETCNSRNCTFLHETSDDHDSFSREDLSSMNALSTQRSAPSSSSAVGSARPQQTSQPQAPAQKAPHTVSATSHSMARQGSRDEPMSRSDSGDGSALPSSASWGKKNVHVDSRGSSKPASIAAPSPVISNAQQTANSTPSTQQQPTEQPPIDLSGPSDALDPATAKEVPAASALPIEEASPSSRALDRAMKKVLESSFKFTFDRSIHSEETLKEIDCYPLLFDPNGGLVRYRMEQERARNRIKQEEEHNAIGPLSITEEEDNPASGSLQLGGEPDTQEDPSQTSGRGSSEPRSAIQPPRSGSTLISSSPFGSSNFFGNTSNPLQSGRSLTPQQQQQLQILRSGNSQQNIFTSQSQQGYSGHTSMHHHQQSNPFQNQTFGGNPSHTRQASRFAFATDSTSNAATIKPTGIPQQSGMLPSGQAKQFQGQPFQPSNTPFYSGVQGPPPGLKSSGTPPVSGGGMFGQGHGFASAMGGTLGLGNASGASKDTNEELMRELLRGRGNVNGQSHDGGKREFKFPSNLPSATSSTAPASSLLNSLYGSQLGTHNGSQDHNLQKQKKKGKKHRHANTSSSGGGGLVTLADPSILRARMHHGGAGQGQYGVQGPGGYNPNSVMYGGGYGSQLFPQFRPTTPPTGTLSKGPNQKAPGPSSFDKPLSSPGEQSSTRKPTPPGLQDFPALPAPQARPSALARKTTTAQIATPAIKPAVPVVPNPSQIASSQTKGAPSQNNSKQETEAAAGSTIDATGTASEPQPENYSTGNQIIGERPLTNTAASSRDGRAAEVLIREAPTEEVIKSKKPGRTSERKRPPSKLDIAAAKNKTKEDGKSLSTSKDPMTIETAPPSASNVSQPSTPTKTTLQSAASTASRPQPRTIRVAPSTQAEPVAKPALSSPSVTEPSSAVTNKPLSRRPSLTSVQAPGTPISERISDNASLTSTSMSRANSPPPSKVGAAPVRHVSKSQQKKERQARAKQAEEAVKAELVPEKPMPEEQQQAPIVGRKKKSKKTRSTADSTPTATRPNSPEPVITEEVIEEKPESLPATPVKTPKDDIKHSTPKPETTREAESPATAEAPAPSASHATRTNLSAASILPALEKAGELSPNIQDLFKGVPGLNYRFDIAPTEYPDSPSMPPLTDAQCAELDRGGAVAVETSPNKRVVVLPHRLTVGGLSKEQAHRYIVLHKQLLQTPDLVFFNSARPGNTSQPHLPGLHPQTKPTPLSSHEELGNRFVSAPSLEQQQQQQQQQAGKGGYWPGLLMGGGKYGGEDNPRGGPQRPITAVEDAEAAMNASRRETEGLEKKLNAILRRNRRVGFGVH